MDDDLGLCVVEQPRHAYLGREVVLTAPWHKRLRKSARLHRCQYRMAKETCASRHDDA
jgi:hypothetical protein